MKKLKIDLYLNSPILASFLIVFALLLAPSLGQAQGARQIAQNAFPSVVLLAMEDTNSQPVSLGSGFFVKADIVATNLHVIESAARGYAKIVGQKPKYEIAGIVGIDTQRDLVLLKITGGKAPSLTFGDINQVAVGDEVYVIGNPQGLEGTFSQGIVSSIRQVGSDTFFQITAPISPGSSGGPVLNAQGKVIGIAVATFSGGQNLNFAIPASYLASLLSELKPAAPLSAKATTKQKKSIIDDLGKPSVESITGEQLTWDQTFTETAHYSFTLRNQLHKPVDDVKCLVVFYDRTGSPIDVDVVFYSSHSSPKTNLVSLKNPSSYNGWLIPAGLAKRVTGGVHPSVQKLTSKVEIRILDFRIVE